MHDDMDIMIEENVDDVEKNGSDSDLVHSG